MFVEFDGGCLSGLFVGVSVNLFVVFDGVSELRSKKIIFHSRAEEGVLVDTLLAWTGEDLGEVS